MDPILGTGNSASRVIQVGNSSIYIHIKYYNKNNDNTMIR